MLKKLISVLLVFSFMSYAYSYDKKELEKMIEDTRIQIQSKSSDFKITEEKNSRALKTKLIISGGLCLAGSITMISSLKNDDSTKMMIGSGLFLSSIGVFFSSMSYSRMEKERSLKDEIIELESTLRKYEYTLHNYDRLESITINDLVNGIVRIGQTKDIVRYILGDPLSINRTVVNYSIQEQWVYWGGLYYYFENDVLYAFQD